MLTKGLKQLLAEANAVIDQISVHDALGMVDDPDTVFIDVRETHEREQRHIPGSVHAPRGFLEFIADPEGPMHNPAISEGRALIVYCGTGGRSALAARTLRDMGFPKVRALVGGLAAWAEAGGRVEG